MRAAVGLRWERAVALVVSVCLMLVVALSVVGALPAQASESAGGDVTVEVVVDDGLSVYGGGSFGGYGASFSTWGNSWG